MHKSSAKKMSIWRGSGRTMTCEEYAVEDASIEPEPGPVFQLVEKMAEFKGHKDGIEAFILDNLIYPLDALAEGLEGSVFVEFIIEKDGSISEVVVLSSGHEAFEKEAIRLVELTDKKWKAGRQSGQEVRSKMIVEVVFKLSD
jgi:protein TonB